LLPESLFPGIDRLDVVCRRFLHGKLPADQTGRRYGATTEFAGYRDYAGGDDPRLIDWNIYARMNRLVVKLFESEVNISLHLLLDCSKSCDFGEPNKSLYIKRVAAALGYIALAHRHHLTLSAFADGLVAQGGPLYGRSRLPEAVNFVAGLACGGMSRFEASARRFADQHRQRGICVILSDFMFKEGLESGLGLLCTAGHELFCLQMLSPQEISPSPGEPDVRLSDMEDQRSRFVQINPSVLDRYRANLEASRQSVQTAVRRFGGTYQFAATDTPLDELVLKSLREKRLLV